jgi:hypothetical protein
MEHVFSAQAVNLQLYIKLQIVFPMLNIQMQELQAFLGIFWACPYFLICIYLLDAPKYILMPFKAVCGHLILQLFSLSKLVSFSSPIIIAASESYTVKDLLQIIFHKCPWRKGCLS